MDTLERSKGTDLKISFEYLPAEPLWKRAPSRDEQGRPLSDFMMIVPGLSTRSHDHIQRTLREIETVLNTYRHAVIFADMNLRLNILWVTVRPIPGVCLELATAVKLCVPEALLVAHKQE